MFTLHCQPLGCVLSTVYFILCRSTNSYIHYFLLSTFLGHYCFQVHPYTGSFLLMLTSYPCFIVNIYFSIHQNACFQNCFVGLCGSDASDHLFCTYWVFTVVLMPLTRALVLVVFCVCCVFVFGPDPPQQLFYCCGYFSPTRLPSKWSGLSQTTHPLLANDGKWLWKTSELFSITQGDNQGKKWRLHSQKSRSCKTSFITGGSQLWQNNKRG